MKSAIEEGELTKLATELNAAWLANGNTRADATQATTVLRAVSTTLSALEQPPAPEEGRAVTPVHVPAVSVRKSLADPERIVSMIDGRAYASLKRHLAAHGLSPSEYRTRYKLKPDYPMVAPGYSAQRSATAKKTGLGRKVVEGVKHSAADAVAAVEKSGAAALKGARKKLRIKG